MGAAPSFMGKPTSEAPGLSGSYLSGSYPLDTTCSPLSTSRLSSLPSRSPSLPSSPLPTCLPVGWCDRARRQEDSCGAAPSCVRAGPARLGMALETPLVHADAAAFHAATAPPRDGKTLWRKARIRTMHAVQVKQKLIGLQALARDTALMRSKTEAERTRYVLAIMFSIVVLGAVTAMTKPALFHMSAVGRWDNGNPYRFSYALSLTFIVFVIKARTTVTRFSDRIGAPGSHLSHPSRFVLPGSDSTPGATLSVSAVPRSEHGSRFRPPTSRATRSEPRCSPTTRNRTQSPPGHRTARLLTSPTVAEAFLRMARFSPDRDRCGFERRWS